MLSIGSHIREIRKAKKVTLVELSARTGVAQATLSRIETGTMIGTVESHQKVAEALGVSLSELYTGVDDRAKEIDYSKSGNRTPKKMGQASCEVLVTSASSKKMLPTLIKIDEKGEISFDAEEVGVEKFFYCLKGEVELGLKDTSYTLKSQQSLYFDASLPHTVKNNSAKLAEIFAVTSPPRI